MTTEERQAIRERLSHWKPEHGSYVFNAEKDIPALLEALDATEVENANLRVYAQHGPHCPARMHPELRDPDLVRAGCYVCNCGLAALLEAAPKQRHLWCPKCGPIEFTDEDGCCKTCGGDVAA